MDVIKRISDLTEERGWSTYKLAQKSGLSRNTVPSLSTLETLCDAFGITLSQFFAEDASSIPLTPAQKEMFDKWANLTPSQKEIIEKLIQEFH